MNQKDVAFALELVARALSGRTSTDPEDDCNVTTYTLEDVGRELIEYAAKLKAAPVSDGFVRCARIDGDPCIHHPLGGPDCVA